GLLGEALKRAGFANVTGLDLTAAMLGRAKGKNCYQKLFRSDLNWPLPVKPSSFAAVTCIGAFTLGHVRATAVDHIVEALKPEGLLVCDIELSSWERYGFQSKFESMLDARSISLSIASWVISTAVHQLTNQMAGSSPLA